MSSIKGGVFVSKINFKKVLTVGSRYVLGLIFFLSGLAGLLNLAPPPSDMPEGLMNFFKGVMAAVYFLPFLKLTETIFGLLLILRIAPALALVVLAPVTIHIVFVHAFLTPGIENLVLPLVMVILHISAALTYWQKYRPLFDRK